MGKCGSSRKALSKSLDRCGEKGDFSPLFIFGVQLWGRGNLKPLWTWTTRQRGRTNAKGLNATLRSADNRQSHGSCYRFLEALQMEVGPAISKGSPRVGESADFVLVPSRYKKTHHAGARHRHLQLVCCFLAEKGSRWSDYSILPTRCAKRDNAKTGKYYQL